MTALDRALTDIAAYEAAAGQRSRAARRRYAETVSRDGLLKYLSSESFAMPVRRAAMWAVADQLNPEAGLELLRALWTEYRRNMAGDYRLGRSAIGSTFNLRKNLSAVVRLYRNQRASVNAQRMMGGLFETINQAAE